MNLRLHGVGTANGPSLIEVKDALQTPGHAGRWRFSNPPTTSSRPPEINDSEDLTAARGELEQVAASPEAAASPE